MLYNRKETDNLNQLWYLEPYDQFAASLNLAADAGPLHKKPYFGQPRLGYGAEVGCPPELTKLPDNIKVVGVGDNAAATSSTPVNPSNYDNSDLPEALVGTGYQGSATQSGPGAQAGYAPHSQMPPQQPHASGYPPPPAPSGSYPHPPPTSSGTYPHPPPTSAGNYPPPPPSSGSYPPPQQHQGAPYSPPPPTSAYPDSPQQGYPSMPQPGGPPSYPPPQQQYRSYPSPQQNPGFPQPSFPSPQQGVGAYPPPQMPMPGSHQSQYPPPPSNYAPYPQ